MKTRNIVLVDDHVIVRNGLKELIEKLGPYKVTAQFDHGRAFLEALPMTPAPDLVVMDMNMPEMDGAQTVEALQARSSAIPVLILTLDCEEETVVRLFRNGVRGYLKKDCDAAGMKAALEDIFRHGYYHNEFLTLSLRGGEKKQKKTERDEIWEQLTDRERAFLKLVCDSREYTYGQIADAMNVQHRTVDGYREAIFDKFGIKSKTGLVLFVLKHQLFELL